MNYLSISSSYNVRPEQNKKIISYSLYGIGQCLDKSRGFYKGIFVNFELAKTVYPEWIIRVYMPDDEPVEFINAIIKIKEIELFLVDTNLCLRALRYLPNDDPLVDIWISRDLDSIVTFREKAAVDDWLTNHPDKELHIMADNPGHIWIITGGMFGKKNNNNRTLTTFMIQFSSLATPNEYAVDCLIAEQFFYRPNNYIQHRSNGYKLNNSVPFPSHDITNCTFVGDIVDINKHYVTLDIQNKCTDAHKCIIEHKLHPQPQPPQPEPQSPQPQPQPQPRRQNKRPLMKLMF